MVESVALEMRSAGNGTEGSNPSLSSILLFFDQGERRPGCTGTACATYPLMLTSEGAASAPTNAPMIRNSTI